MQSILRSLEMLAVTINDFPVNYLFRKEKRLEFPGVRICNFNACLIPLSMINTILSAIQAARQWPHLTLWRCCSLLAMCWRQCGKLEREMRWSLILILSIPCGSHQDLENSFLVVWKEMTILLEITKE